MNWIFMFNFRKHAFIEGHNVPHAFWRPIILILFIENKLNKQHLHIIKTFCPRRIKATNWSSSATYNENRWIYVIGHHFITENTLYLCWNNMLKRQLKSCNSPICQKLTIHKTDLAFSSGCRINFWLFHPSTIYEDFFSTTKMSVSTVDAVGSEKNFLNWE